MRRTWKPSIRPLASVSMMALVVSCGGGGGSSNPRNTGVDITDPVIPLVGTTGKYSLTPEQANAAFNAPVLTPPPLMPTAAQNNQNQFLRLECPFEVDPASIITPDPLLQPFSQLTGTITISDEIGNHLRCVVVVNGRDAFGVDRTGDVGFPSSLTASGKDLNVGPGVILFIADDGDGDLSTIASFGGRLSDSDSRADTTEITQIRLTVAEINGRRIDGFYTVTVGNLGDSDMLSPTLISVVADSPNPANPLALNEAATSTKFRIRFNEPCIPTTVGQSVELNDPLFYLGNLPRPNAPPRPLPNLHLRLTPVALAPGAMVAPIFVPCDVTPLNSNNLSVYIARPLIELPAFSTVTVVIADATANMDIGGNSFAALDFAGNIFSPGADQEREFEIGPGRSPVNAPVSPEAIYWLPSGLRGLGAIDLNGMGFNTNKPGANAGDFRKAAIITRPYVPPNFTTGMNLINGRALSALPVGAAHNQYAWPVGTGGYSYGPGDPNTPDWADPADMGNPGTPVPGINEMSSGFESLVRDAAGEIILTGRRFSEVGTVNDIAVGEFLDMTIFDTGNFNASAGQHQSLFFPAVRTGVPSNSIGEPPVPNPPPSRYWVGLQPIDLVVDQAGRGAQMIEGEEIWAGDQSFTAFLNLGVAPSIQLFPQSYQWVLPNPDGMSLPDVPPPHLTMVPSNQIPSFSASGSGPPAALHIFPYLGQAIGPTPQSATAGLAVPYSARQQIGNYLYVTDVENRQLHALNSNTFEIIESIDLPDPTGLGISSESRYLFVSNSADDSLSIIGCDPRELDFHQEIARVQVGAGPNTVSVQPDDEDVFVGNLGDNSVSIVSFGSFTVRRSVNALISTPTEIICSPRQSGFGFLTGIYQTYIANTTANSIVVYESGPDGPQGIGCNNIVGALPTDEQPEIDFLEPRGMCYSPFPNPQGLIAGGVFIAHRDTSGVGVVSHLQFTHQVIPGPLPCAPPPRFFQVPKGFNDRSFEVVAQWGLNETNLLLGTRPVSVVLPDIRRSNYMRVPTDRPNNSDMGFDLRGNPAFNSRFPVRNAFQNVSLDTRPTVPAWEPDRLYVAFEDTDVVQVLDPVITGRTVGTVEATGVGVRKLVTYFKQ